MSVLSKEYDVIVVGGGGINGLACAAYLQKAGLKVACFDRAHEAGVFCNTDETLHPGAKLNLCATLMVTPHSPAFEELELERFGFEALTSNEWALFHAFEDKTAVMWHNWDMRKQVEHWARFSEKDGETLRKLTNYFAPHWPDLIEASAYSKPTQEAYEKQAKIVGGCPVIPRGDPHIGEASGLEMCDLIWESEKIKTAILAMAVAGGHEPWTRGTGLGIALFRPFLGSVIANGYFARGGSHYLTHALVRCFLHYGGALFQGCRVDKIIVENNTAKGIVLSKDAIFPEAEIRATKAVVSNVSVKPTFLDMIGADKLKPEHVAGVKAYAYDSDILFTNYYFLNERPNWPGFPPECNEISIFNWGCETPADILRLHNDHVQEKLPDPPIGIGGSCQGFWMDPSQAPQGQYPVMTWTEVPYYIRRHGGPMAWDDIREEYGDKVENHFVKYMGNVKSAKVARYICTPLDNYRRNPSAIEGTWSGGPRYRMHQYWSNKPFIGCNAPKSPIDKLYLSQSTWPVASSALGMGIIAADEIARDFGVRKQDWWNIRAVEPYWRMLRRRGHEPIMTA